MSGEMKGNHEGPGKTQSLPGGSPILILWGKILSALISICSLLLIFLTSIITIEVFYRFITGRPITGVFEISEILLLTITFLALPYVYYSNHSISLDFIVSRLRGRPLALSNIINAVCCLIFFCIIVYTSLRDTIEAYENDFLWGGLIHIPLFIPLFIIFVGSAAISISLSIAFFRNAYHLVVPPRAADKGQ